LSKKNNHNPIYFLTTLSVYLGLVLVGASPQVLAQAKLTESSQTQSFQITTKTTNAFSELKLKSKFKYENTLPFVFLGSSKFTNRSWKTHKYFRTTANLHEEIFAENNQVLLFTHFPRASI
jgi:hypothetical protein